MKQSLSPGVTWAVIAVLVLGAAIGFWYFTSPRPQALDLTKVSKEDLEDRDPPHKGQPGYRERTTDPPAK